MKLAMVAVLNVSFDKSLPEESERAEACYAAAATAVIAAGYIPYRSSPGGLARLRVPGDVFWETARQIKKRPRSAARAGARALYSRG